MGCPSQWVVPVVGAWALLEEESHSSPGRGRSLRSDNWLDNRSDSKIANPPVCDSSPSGWSSSTDHISTLRGQKLLGMVSPKRGDSGAAGTVQWHPVRDWPDTGHPGRSGRRGSKSRISGVRIHSPLSVDAPWTGAWAFLQEENPSSPGSGRSRRSDVWLRNGSDSGVFSTCLLGDNLLGQRPLLERNSTSRG